MRKKVLALICSFVLAGSLFACGSKPVLDKKNPVTINLWHYYSGANLAGLEESITEFNSSVGLDEGIIVVPSAYGSVLELMAAVEGAAGGVVGMGDMPDIFSTYPDFAMDIDSRGMLCDLNLYFSDEEKQSYVNEFLNDGIFSDDRLLIVPVAKSTEIFYLNKTSWDEVANEINYSLDDLRSWDKLYEISKSFYEYSDAQTADVLWDGKSFMGIDSVANFIIVGAKQMGVDIISSDDDGGVVVINSSVMRRLFDVYYRAYVMGYFDAIGRFRSDDVKSDDMLGFAGSTSGAAYFPTDIIKGNKQISIDFYAAPYPCFSNGEEFAIQQGAGMAVTKSSEAKQLASAIFLKWFTSAGQNINFAMNSGYLPVQVESYRDDEFENIINDMKNGDKSLQNMAEVYDISLAAVLDNKTYAATPFAGSNDVRNILEDSLKQGAENGRKTVLPLKDKGLSEEEIYDNLDLDRRFDNWINEITTNLERSDIRYIIIE